MLREPGQAPRVVHDHHVEGLFPEHTWLHLLEHAGFAPSVERGTADPDDDTSQTATAKAALQSTQNVTTMTGSGRAQEADWVIGMAGSAERMGISFRAATFMAGTVHLEIK